MATKTIGSYKGVAVPQGLSQPDLESFVRAIDTSKNEPAVLSSISGEEKFNSKIQPQIDRANNTVAAATKGRNDIAAAAAKGEDLPTDVQIEQDITDRQLALYDKQQKDAIREAKNLTLAYDESASAELATATSSWGERRQLLEQSNKANKASWNQQFIRFGQAEYSPGMTADFLTQKEREGLNELKKLDNQYLSTVASINAAKNKGKVAVAAQLTASLNGIQEKALSLIKKNAEEARATNEKLREAIIKSSRESAIGNLIQQYGITDPAELQQLLNYDDSGAQIGDISLDEISKVLKVMGKDQDMAGLSADFKTFNFLQKNNPDMIKGMNYFDYLNAVSNAKKTTGGGGGDFTATEKRKLEQAGLLGAPRQDQLDFLYGGDGGGDDWETARQFIADNPDASRDELSVGLRQNTKLTDGDINTLLDEEGALEEKGNIAGSESDIAIALVKELGDVESARAYLESGGTVNINDKDIQLSRRQIQDIVDAMEEEYPSGSRSFWETVLPFGK